MLTTHYICIALTTVAINASEEPVMWYARGWHSPHWNASAEFMNQATLSFRSRRTPV